VLMRVRKVSVCTAPSTMSSDRAQKPVAALCGHLVITIKQYLQISSPSVNFTFASTTAQATTWNQEGKRQ
jgi:hypothetical protein